eukprot:CAMPEP_0118852516 /NCGR_PEP_ID=MMETSP1163-20130328/1489_1 /TAXON_ID=124430 /ORGANISM="Phaeomonas parva, Strain CCMP2877" /LENGTH=128 /DNA_ID=CAMNT_0006784951 /DNA_START=121 /DNA_END=507 /DNA_ORIENTATION=+
MAKGLRSKQKKRMRAEMRRTVGAAFEKEKMAETNGHLQDRLQAVGVSLSNLMALRGKLGGAAPAGDAMATDESAKAAEAPTLINHYHTLSVPGKPGKKGRKAKRTIAPTKVSKKAKVTRKSRKKMVEF